jgi:hypothetical protein
MPFAVDQKNWLVMRSPSGVRAAAIFYFLIEPYKASNIKPYKYLCTMLHRIRECVTEDDYRKLLPQLIRIQLILKADVRRLDAYGVRAKNIGLIEEF